VDRRYGGDHRGWFGAGGGVQRRLRHAGIGVEGGGRADRGALRRLRWPGDLRGVEGSGRCQEPGGTRARRRLLRRRRAGGARRRAHADPGLARRHDRIDHAAPDGSGLGRREGAGRGADRRGREAQRRRARGQAGREPDPRRPGGGQPGGDWVRGRRDRAFDRVRLGRRRRPAARDRAGRPRYLVRRPDRPARQRGRRARLDDGGVGADRDRGWDRLRAAGPDPLPGRDERRQGPPRRRAGGGHHRGPQRGSSPARL
jgi:hypothetical protein